jgi:hypothetical protein
MVRSPPLHNLAAWFQMPIRAAFCVRRLSEDEVRLAWLPLYKGMATITPADQL